MSITVKLPIEVVGDFMRSAPVNVEGLAAALGLEIQRKNLPDNVSGKIECETIGPCKITVNSIHPRTRQRFTIAHEIAHFILHRDLIGDGIIDDGMYRSGRSKLLERQANQYAANILMPWQLVVEKQHRQGITTALDMAKIFEVSPAVAEIRLKELQAFF
jgi:Zn-dependent peptidase ImmA (M78 family)